MTIPIFLFPSRTQNRLPKTYKPMQGNDVVNNPMDTTGGVNAFYPLSTHLLIREARAKLYRLWIIRYSLPADAGQWRSPERIGACSASSVRLMTTNRARRSLNSLVFVTTGIVIPSSYRKGKRWIPLEPLTSIGGGTGLPCIGVDPKHAS